MPPRRGLVPRRLPVSLVEFILAKVESVSIVESMIRSFACPQTEKLFTGGRNKLPKEIQRVALRKLLMLSQANTIEEMKFPPSNRLHPLLKDRDGQYAVWINKKYRLCFRFENGEAYDAEITDYH